MEFSNIGRAALRAREGEILTAYYDTVGVLTIGVGITNAAGLIKIVPGLKITAEQSDNLFKRAVENYADTVRKSIKANVTQEFFDACVSLCYNIGQGGFAKSTVVRLANAGNIQGAADAFLLWNKPSSILSRRQAERNQALTPYNKELPKARSVDRTGIKVIPSNVQPSNTTMVPAVATKSPTQPVKTAASNLPVSNWSKVGSALTNFFSRRT